MRSGVAPLSKHAPLLTRAQSIAGEDKRVSPATAAHMSTFIYLSASRRLRPRFPTQAQAAHFTISPIASHPHSPAWPELPGSSPYSAEARDTPSQSTPVKSPAPCRRTRHAESTDAAEERPHDSYHVRSANPHLAAPPYTHLWPSPGMYRCVDPATCKTLSCLRLRMPHDREGARKGLAGRGTPPTAPTRRENLLPYASDQCSDGASQGAVRGY
ncbi:hypothetical protein L227DRAFT_219899 [Lentinus tigrinus ALCF2SS1-6]|uniref:Uncharacterized protein n=1 Tax=Lentinus tigrinus ALCF2SS1-6 TaxID=1328759 RepID=A0A5C2SPL3_9APHY|nr:hypothetical protein L227DRAFT_219899 [Lentinus tigrinus ALCF2SS1-6]